jgi:hypothetical protein
MHIPQHHCRERLSSMRELELVFQKVANRRVEAVVGCDASGVLVFRATCACDETGEARFRFVLKPSKEQASDDEDTVIARVELLLPVRRQGIVTLTRMLVRYDDGGDFVMKA